MIEPDARARSRSSSGGGSRDFAHARGERSVGSLGAVVGAVVLQAVGERLLGGLYPVGGTAWPAPLVGAILGERLTARIATDWERGQRP